MHNNTQTDPMASRRRTYDRVVIADARIVDRRQSWRARKDARDFLELRAQQFAQSRQAHDYALDAMTPELVF